MFKKKKENQFLNCSFLNRKNILDLYQLICCCFIFSLLCYFLKSTWFAFRPVSNFSINNNKGINRENICHPPIMDPTLCFISFVLKLCDTLESPGKIWKILKPRFHPIPVKSKCPVMATRHQCFFGNHCFISPYPLNSPLK